MKKFTVYLMILALVMGTLAFAGCGSSDEETQAAAETIEEAADPTEAAEDATDETTAATESTEDPTNAAYGDGDDGEGDDDFGDTEELNDNWDVGGADEFDPESDEEGLE